MTEQMLLNYIDAVSELIEAVEQSIKSNAIDGKLVLSLSKLRTEEEKMSKMVDFLERKVVKYN
jgi:hypothetical protein